jgi:hypothetical protein
VQGLFWKRRAKEEDDEQSVQCRDCHERGKTRRFPWGIDRTSTMPEFPGWVGLAVKKTPVLRVTGITHRADPIFQTLVGPGAEHVTLSGLTAEASVYQPVNDAMPGFLQNVYLHPSGGGKWLAILQIKKRALHDEGRQRQAALQALAAFYELKHVIPGVLGHPIDPTSRPEYNPMIREVGTTCKTIFDCTAPFRMADRFERAQFIDVDPEKFLL